MLMRDYTNRVLRMLAVMTYNIGYLMSVLAGTFVGELIVGRYAAVSERH